jgi:hypothetical protein
VRPHAVQPAVRHQPEASVPQVLVDMVALGVGVDPAEPVRISLSTATAAAEGKTMGGPLRAALSGVSLRTGGAASGGAVAGSLTREHYVRSSPSHHLQGGSVEPTKGFAGEGQLAGRLLHWWTPFSSRSS